MVDAVLASLIILLALLLPKVFRYVVHIGKHNRIIRV